MNTSDIIATAAVILAAAATFYAKRSADSARSAAQSAERANHLALHNERLVVYAALQEFKRSVERYGHGFPDTAVWSLSEAARLSEFCLPQRHYKTLSHIVDTAVKVKGSRSDWEDYRTAGDTAQAEPALVQLHAQTAELRNLCDTCDRDLREHLRHETEKAE